MAVYTVGYMSIIVLVGEWIVRERERVIKWEVWVKRLDSLQDGCALKF